MHCADVYCISAQYGCGDMGVRGVIYAGQDSGKYQAQYG